MRAKFFGTTRTAMLAIALFGAMAGGPNGVRAESNLQLSASLSNSTAGGDLE